MASLAAAELKIVSRRLQTFSMLKETIGNKGRVRVAKPARTTANILRVDSIRNTVPTSLPGAADGVGAVGHLVALLEAVPALDRLGAVGAGVPLLPAVEALVRHLAVLLSVALGNNVIRNQSSTTNIVQSKQSS
jgi:hypothetical protein